MSVDLDKILNRLDNIDDDDYQVVQDSKPNDELKDLYDMGHIKILDFWAEMEDRRKARDLKVTTKVQDLIRSIKKETLDDQSELLDRFKDILDL